MPSMVAETRPKARAKHDPKERTVATADRRTTKSGRATRRERAAIVTMYAAAAACPTQT